jgi:hypothetical protein
MATPLRVGDIVRVPEASVGETVVDEVFDDEAATRLKRAHPIGARCERLVARDPGDNLIVFREGAYHYWDHESDQLILLGPDPSEFVAGNDA